MSEQNDVKVARGVGRRVETQRARESRGAAPWAATKNGALMREPNACALIER